MFFIVYKTTNVINGKYYIGKHKTNNINDGYLGSGKLLKRAISKYGKHNFIRIILDVFDNEDDMNEREKELVVISEESYNVCPGGQGGFGYINNNGLNNSPNKKYDGNRNRIYSEEAKRSFGDNLKKAHREGRIRYNTFEGRKHSPETIEKMRISARRRCQNTA